MKFTNNVMHDTDWLDVAPTIFRVHDMGLNPYMMRWPYVAWLAIEHAGYTQASDELQRHDVKLKAVSITLLHTEFLRELFLSFCDLRDEFLLEGITTKTKIIEILERMYSSPASDYSGKKYSDEEIFLDLYIHHRKQIASALLAQFKSVEALFDSMLELAKMPEDRDPPFSLSQLGSAMSFVSEFVDESGHQPDDSRIFESSSSAAHARHQDVT